MPFAVWTSSGMENPLYVFLIVLYFYLVTKLSFKLEVNLKICIRLGIVAALIAMTRPDGVLYFFVLPIFLLVSVIFWQKSTSKC